MYCEGMVDSFGPVLPHKFSISQKNLKNIFFNAHVMPTCSYKNAFLKY